VLDQSALEFERANAIVRSLEDIIGSADKREIAVSVLCHYIACSVILSREWGDTAIILLVAWRQSQRRRIKRHTEFTFVSPLFVEIQEGEPETGQRSAHGCPV
jgi:hypothetical protein